MLLTLTSAAWLIRFATAGRADVAPWSVGLQIALVLLLVAQVLVEGWRWQMAPVYLLCLLVVGNVAVLIGAPATRIAFALAGLGLACASILSCLVFQHLTVPSPSGAAWVGVTTLAPVRRTNSSPSSANGESLPPPLVRLWYPAARPSLSQRIRTFVNERLARSLKSADSVPASPDAEPAPGDAQYPVVIYLGGWPEDSVQNRALLCELASRGFVVASLHPAPAPGLSKAEIEAQRALLSRPMLDYSSDSAFARSVELDNDRARTFGRDASATLNTLAALAHGGQDRRFAHRLDLQRAGILGFSFGGAVAAQASHDDSRIKAVVNLDGRHWAEVLQKGVTVPYLFVGEELLMPSPADLASSNPAIRYEAQMDQIDYTQLANNLRANGGTQVTIAGTAHSNFTDDVLRSPVRRFSGGGPIDPHRALLIVNSLVAEFFEQQLTGRPSALLSSNPRPFPEARAEYWPRVN